MKKLVVFTCAAALVAGCYAATTQTWQHSTQADFEKGKITRLSLRSDGLLTLAPVFKDIYDPSAPYLWAVAENSKGHLFAGGSNGESSSVKLYEIDPAGKGSVLVSLPGLSINAIAVDSKDRVYVGTSPDGKVYRITAPNQHEVFYDPKAKYIWGLAFNKQGDLFVATGDKGEVHRVTAAGSGSVLFKSDETHARSIAVDDKGNLFVGTEPGGLILRVPTTAPATGPAEGFVLYQASKREITALAVHPNGSLYAAAVGNKTAGSTAPPPPLPTPSPTPAPSTSGPPAPGAGNVPRAPTAQAAPVPSLGTSISGGSEVWRIEPDGYPRKLWSHVSEIAYAMAFDPQGRALIGTGNRGNIYRLDSDLLSTLLINAAPTQVTGLVSGRQGRVIAITGNIGKVLQLGPETEKDGSYEGEVLDAAHFSYWGRIHYTGSTGGGAVTLETRSGNLDLPQRNWSSWAVAPLNSDHGRIASPPARFLQYKVTLKAAQGGASPEFSSVDVAYLPKNVAPVLELIGITPANYRFPIQSLTLTPSQNLTLPPLSRNPRSSSSSLSSDTPSNSMNYARGHIGARWLARDENGDSLLSKVEIRGAQESTWKVLKDEVKERNLSWDSTAFPDGEYRIRVTVTDSPSNPPHQSLTTSLESDAFVIDNTPPRIEPLTATRSGARVEVRWRAADQLNVISTAEYSVDGGSWLTVEPTTRLSDSRQHDYVLTLENLPAGEHTVAVRVTDEYDNQSVAKTVVR
jgi:sugar lactone lactonase YvrE